MLPKKREPPNSQVLEITLSGKIHLKGFSTELYPLAENGGHKQFEKHTVKVSSTNIFTHQSGDGI